MGKLSVGRQSQHLQITLVVKHQSLMYMAEVVIGTISKIVKQFKVFNNTIWHYVR